MSRNERSVKIAATRLATSASIALLAALSVLPVPAGAAGVCSMTARQLFRACGFDVLDDFWVASANCLNVSDPVARQSCRDDAAAERQEGQALCREQREGRLEACDVLGDDAYDPQLDPQRFDDPTEATHPNPYFPLAVGNVWEYESEDETNVVEVLDETKLIGGIRCLVVRDRVFRDGKLTEDTDDWFAQAVDGEIWYCGEEVKEYESFAGDAPRRPELVSIEGSFKVGREGAKPGRIFLASPRVGDTYLEEFSLGNAEDVSEILAVDYSYGEDDELDDGVPQALADALCDDDCIVTLNTSLLEPGVIERKYYAPGIGVFLEVEPEEGVVSRLVDCNFDRRCATLPRP